MLFKDVQIFIIMTFVRVLAYALCGLNFETLC